jgi:hypothetical protein
LARQASGSYLTQANVDPCAEKKKGKILDVSLEINQPSRNEKLE